MKPVRSTWKRAASLVSLTTALLFGLFPAPASADALTPCVLAGPPILGDGPLVGDAPDGVDVPVTTGCYNGTVSDAEDEDRYLKVPRPNQLLVKALDGCFHVDIELVFTGGVTPKDLCAGQQVRLGFLGPAQPLRLTFSNGPGVYWFLLE